MCAIAGASTSIHDFRSEVGKMSLGEDFDCIADTSLNTFLMLTGASTYNDEPVRRRIHCMMDEQVEIAVPVRSTFLSSKSYHEKYHSDPGIGVHTLSTTADHSSAWYGVGRLPLSTVVAVQMPHLSSHDSKSHVSSSIPSLHDDTLHCMLADHSTCVCANAVSRAFCIDILHHETRLSANDSRWLSDASANDSPWLADA